MPTFQPLLIVILGVHPLVWKKSPKLSNVHNDMLLPLLNRKFHFILTFQFVLSEYQISAGKFIQIFQLLLIFIHSFPPSLLNRLPRNFIFVVAVWFPKLSQLLFSGDR